MRLIVGLGNPGEKYRTTRHNIGFMVVDRLARERGLAWRRGFEGLYCNATGENLVLLKPQTFMNLSGRSVLAAANWWRIAPGEILVVYDDLDLEPGRIRLRTKGGSGGHKGVKSVIACLGTEEFYRLRVGIGRPGPDDPIDVVDYVLQAPGESERTTTEQALTRAAAAIEHYLAHGFASAMNQFNQDTE
ncbi:MAG: aminoacyl-tRNA hydrolase [Bacillota bacterium]